MVKLKIEIKAQYHEKWAAPEGFSRGLLAGGIQRGGFRGEFASKGRMGKRPDEERDDEERDDEERDEAERDETKKDEAEEKR
jgi:hypothetical protein